MATLKSMDGSDHGAGRPLTQRTACRAGAGVMPRRGGRAGLNR